MGEGGLDCVWKMGCEGGRSLSLSHGLLFSASETRWIEGWKGGKMAARGSGYDISFGNLHV